MFMRTALLSALLVAPAAADDDYRVGGVGRFDIDGDGEITRSEYNQSFENRMKDKIEWLDLNKDGLVSPQEFREQHQAEYDARWRRWDPDGDGVASVVEVQELKHKQQQRQEGRTQH